MKLLGVLVLGLLALAVGAPMLLTLGVVAAMPWLSGGVLELPAAAGVQPGDTAPPRIAAGAVSDVERYQLITAAGAAREVAIVMTALSIAEDGSGNPAIVSLPNWNRTVDNGLWQVNSAHIGQCGIVSQAWLFDPMNNARAAMCILGPGLNYCAWSTFEARCGVGHTGAYKAFIAGATLIAQGIAWQH